MDFNVDPMAAIVFWRNGNHMHIVDELELPNADTDEMCATLRDRYPKPDTASQSRIQSIYPDASGRARHTSAPAGRSDFTTIKEYGFDIRVKTENPKIRDRENAVNCKLRPRGGEPTLTISPKCRKLISYLRRYSHEEKNKQRNMSHMLDAMGYPVAYLYPMHRTTTLITRVGGL
jgi:hypothetical protein